MCLWAPEGWLLLQRRHVVAFRLHRWGDGSLLDQHLCIGETHSRTAACIPSGQLVVNLANTHGCSSATRGTPRWQKPVCQQCQGILLLQGKGLRHPVGSLCIPFEGANQPPLLFVQGECWQLAGKQAGAFWICFVYCDLLKYFCAAVLTPRSSRRFTTIEVI